MRGLLLPGLLLSATMATPAADDPASISTPNRVTLTRRAVRQDLGAWVVDYRLRNETPAGLIVAPGEIAVRIEGWVSNSRLPGHSIPRRESVAIHPAEKAAAEAVVIASDDESARCRERVSLGVWSDDQPPDPTAKPADALMPISLAPGATGLLRLRFEHDHIVQGGYDPLLGARTIAFRIGQETFQDEPALDREAGAIPPDVAWPEPPAERLDSRYYVSAPDSLHLRADVPGRQYYRFPDRAVRHGARMRLSFWYLIARGSGGEAGARLSQYKDTPTSCRLVPGGGLDWNLTAAGRWVHVEKLVRIDREATVAALEFRLSGDSGVGEMWIDDVAFEPVDLDALAKTP